MKIAFSVCTCNAVGCEHAAVQSIQQSASCRTLPGPKVISKVIPVESIEELSLVLKRPPVIWDNFHANDYDQQSLFLGPYQGRSTSLIAKLNGVLTNPNCEYGANFVPIHTLAQWCKCGLGRQQKKSSAVLAAAELEKEALLSQEASMSGSEGGSSPLLYSPEEALEVALKEWMVEFNVSRRQTQDYHPAKTSRSVSQALSMEEQTTGDGDSGKELGEMREEEEEVVEEEEVAVDGETVIDAEPVAETLSNLELSGTAQTDPFDYDNLVTLVHFFYLPHRHGERAQQIADEFCWLKGHAPGFKQIKACIGDSWTGSDCEEDEEEEEGVRMGDKNLAGGSNGETSYDSHEEEEEESPMNYTQVKYMCVPPGTCTVA